MDNKYMEDLLNKYFVKYGPILPDMSEMTELHKDKSINKSDKTELFIHCLCDGTYYFQCECGNKVSSNNRYCSLCGKMLPIIPKNAFLAPIPKNLLEEINQKEEEDHFNTLDKYWRQGFR